MEGEDLPLTICGTCLSSYPVVQTRLSMCLVSLKKHYLSTLFTIYIIHPFHKTCFLSLIFFSSTVFFFTQSKVPNTPFHCGEVTRIHWLVIGLNLRAVARSCLLVYQSCELMYGWLPNTDGYLMSVNTCLVLSII